MTKNVKKNVNKIYPKEFKQEAIKLALESPSITGTAKSLGIPEATLHTWVRNAKNSGEQLITKSDDTIKHVIVNNILDENRELRKRLARLEQEKAIIKKAATYFAGELK
ncbi:MAG: transposase [Gammaproteobacteria bacterium]